MQGCLSTYGEKVIPQKKLEKQIAFHEWLIHTQEGKVNAFSLETNKTESWQVKRTPQVKTYTNKPSEHQQCIQMCGRCVTSLARGILRLTI